MVLKGKELPRDKATARPLAFTFLPVCSGCFSQNLLRTAKLSVMKNRAFAYFLSQVSSSCSNQYTKAVSLVIFRLLPTNCRDFYFQGLGLSFSILSFQLYFFCFVECFHSFTLSTIFFVCVCASATYVSINSISSFCPRSQLQLSALFWNN